MRTWRAAWAEANECFYAHESPADHFRTSTNHLDVLAPAIAAMVTPYLPVDGDTPHIDVVDVGAGDAGLGHEVARVLTRRGWQCTVRAYDLRAADGVITGRAPQVVLDDPAPTGLLIAHEWLDDIACDRAVIDDDGEPCLMVETDGEMEPGPRLQDPACTHWEVDGQRLYDWWRRWTPCRTPGATVDLGTSRDDAWRSLVSHLAGGVALAIDYAVTHQRRCADGSTVAAYRRGRAVPVTLDGTANITAHVAFDALARAVGPCARMTSMHRQRECIAPAVDIPDDLRGLALRSRIAVLRDPAGLGAFRWLLHRR